MIKSLSQFSLSKHLSDIECLQFVNNIGFQGYEPVVNNAKDLLSGRCDSRSHELKKTAEALNVTITSVATELHWKYALSSEERNIRQRAVDIAKAQIQYCHAVGAEIALIIPGYYAKGLQYADCIKWSQESICELLAFAQRYRVTLAIENVLSGLFTSAQELVAFIDGFRSKWVGAYFDVGNAGYYNHPHLWAEQLGERIKCVHLKDYNTKVGNAHGFCPIFTGSLDFTQIINSLVQTGYTGAIIGEVACNEENPPFIPRMTSLAMDEILCKLHSLPKEPE